MPPVEDSKWIEGLAPDMPVAVAARRVVGLRLQAVAARLGPALHDADDDSEHVHQLRVSTRRAAAALLIFRDCLPDKQYRKTRKQLRVLRRAAGPIRDWDVFLEGLTARCSRIAANQRAGLDFLLGFAHGQRSGAQARLLEEASDSPDALQRVHEDTLAALGDCVMHPGLAGLARCTLGELLHDLTVAAAVVTSEKQTAPLANSSDYEHLHRVRILGKRLRYAMEVFACCFPKDFRAKIYPNVEEMQEILGLANDSHIANQRVGQLRDHVLTTRPKDWRRWQPGVESLLQFHQRRLVKQQRLFLTWWATWHGSPTEACFRQMIGYKDL